MTEALIGHLYSVKGEKKRNKYCRYLPVTINNWSCSALVDSGNVYRTVISDEFAFKLGLKADDIQPLARETVHTAKKGGVLEILGETKKALKMQIYPEAGRGSGEDEKECVSFDIRPVIVKDLGMAINISGPFLKKFNIDQLHSKDALQLPDGRLVKLTQKQAGGEIENAELSVVLKEKRRIPPRSIVYAKATVGNGKHLRTEGVVVGNSGILAKQEVVPWHQAVIKTGEDGDALVGLINPSNQAKVVKAGLRYGTFRRICAEEEKDYFPWRVAVLEMKDETEERICHVKGGVPNKPTVRSKIQDIIEHLKKKKREEGEGGGKEKEPPPPPPRSREEKVRWLEREFRIDESVFVQQDAELKKRLIELLLKFFDIISVSGEFGNTDLIEHEIDTGDTPPIKCKSRPINPYLEEDLKKQVEGNLKKGVIEPSSSPWCFPLVAAPKRGGKLRWCCDYRRLNVATKKDTFPLPNIEDNLARLSRSVVFSTLDGSGAFHVVPIAEKDRQKTAFSTPWGLFQYKKMPFGLCNGPATYSRLVQLALHGIPPSVAMPYLDDIIIHSANLQTHLKDLENVLVAHRKAGLKLQPAKCQLFRAQADYLGFVVSKDGVQTSPDYVKAVQDWKMPTTRSEIRIFLGKTGYYRKFVKGYSAIAAPLTDLAGKGTPEEEKEILEATPERTKAFELLKSKLLSAPVLAYPRFGKEDPPFILDTDWSQENNAIGGVLSQVQDGKERVLMYGGKKMSKAQRNYSPFKGELAALLHFARAWEYYLQRRPFVVRTDHQPLTHLSSMKTPDRHVLRMLATLADLQFVIKYRPGAKHGNADSLSRAPHIRDSPESEKDLGVDEEADERMICALFQEGKQVYSRGAALCSLVSPLNPEGMYSREAMKLMQEEDPDLGPVMTALQEEGEIKKEEVRTWPPDARMYWHLKERLSVGKDGLLRYKRKVLAGTEETDLLCLPGTAKKAIINRVHEEGGHCGVDRTAFRLLQTFYTPHLRAEVQDVLRCCVPCQQKTKSKTGHKVQPEAVVEGYPFQKLALDFVGPLPKVRGYTFVLTVRDTFTKWLEAFPLTAATTEKAIKVLVNDVFRRFGVPAQLHSDRGSQFTSTVFKELAESLDIKHTMTPAYNPRSNPVERVHQDLGNILRAMALQTGRDWVSNLPAAVMAINTNRHMGTNYSPFRLMFGRDPNLPLSLIYGNPVDDQKRPESEYVQSLQDRLSAAFRMARENLKAQVQRQRKKYVTSSSPFAPGDRVWLFSAPPPQKGQPQKLQNFWSGPWTVMKILNPVMVQIKAPQHWKGQKVVQEVTIDRLKRYAEEGEPIDRPPPPGTQLSLPFDEACERPEDMGYSGRDRRRKDNGREEEDEEREVNDNYREEGPDGRPSSPAPVRASSSSSSPSSGGEQEDDQYFQEMRHRHEMDLSQAASRLEPDSSLAWDPDGLDWGGESDLAEQLHRQELTGRRGLSPTPEERQAEEEAERESPEESEEEENDPMTLRSPASRRSTRQSDFEYY